MTTRAKLALQLALNYKRYGTCYPEKEKLVAEAMQLIEQVKEEEAKKRLQEILQTLAA